MRPNNKTKLKIIIFWVKIVQLIKQVENNQRILNNLDNRVQFNNKIKIKTVKEMELNKLLKILRKLLRQVQLK